YRAVRRALRVRRTRVALGAAVAGAAAVAASLWLLVLSPRPAPSPEWAQVKGGPSAGLLELSAAVVSRSGEVSPLAPGGRARATDTLVLRYRAERPGPAYLLESSAPGQLRPLGQFTLQAGTHDLSDGGGVSGVSLDGDRGEVRLWLVQAGGPLTEQSAVEAVLHPASGGDVVVAGFSVRVEAGENRGP
ncbi:MAG TPA: hypothetical protein VND93_26605, partial [Myxococcales bacterium]|nr:hypothetical protein [Myxococcales bacterium]